MNKYYCYIKYDDVRGFDAEVRANSNEEAARVFYNLWAYGKVDTNLPVDKEGE